LIVRASRCYQSEQRMHISPAAGRGAPGQRQSAHPHRGFRCHPCRRSAEG
jgi:hypothetical protein